jgi:hypothetical protein
MMLGEVEVFTLSKVGGRMARGDEHVDHVKRLDELYVSALKHVPQLTNWSGSSSRYTVLASKSFTFDHKTV